MRSAALCLLLLAGCVTQAEWAAVKEQNEELRARFEQGEREGWTKEERAEWRRRLERNEREVEAAKPAEWREVADFAVYGVVSIITLLAGGTVALRPRRRRKDAA